MLQRLVREPDFAVLWRAVGEWYRYYQVAPDERTTVVDGYRRWQHA